MNAECMLPHKEAESYQIKKILVFNLMQVMFIMHFQNTTFPSEVFYPVESKDYGALGQKK